MTNRPPRTLRELYEREVKRRGFIEDAAQLAALDHLENLRTRLLARRRIDRSALHRLLAPLRPPEQPERGVYLYGGVGRGKTWLMDLFYQSLPFPERRRRHFHRFMHDVHAELRTLGGSSAPLDLIAERIAREVLVLCFDELFVTDIGDAMILGGLFAALFQRGVTLVATSNVAPGQLYRDGLQRQRFIPAIELLERNMAVVAVDGAVDYRLRELAQSGTYLPAGTRETARRLEHLFRTLNHGDGASGSIEIEGRSIAVVRAGDNAVWFEFAVICSAPRGTDDYIELAREYQSIFVSNVPRLDASADDAARRFIALVDETYDRGVNLVLSAAAPPAELYGGQRLRQEFERTQSRLAEMQTQQYLAREHRA
jgi:cell division protein ZapE